MIRRGLLLIDILHAEYSILWTGVAGIPCALPVGKYPCARYHLAGTSRT